MDDFVMDELASLETAAFESTSAPLFTTPEQRAAIITELYPLVENVAAGIARKAPHKDLDEMIGDGAIGLIQAIDNFDAALHSDLKAYAISTIRHAIQDGMRRRDPLTKGDRRRFRSLRVLQDAFIQTHGRLPTPTEVQIVNADTERILSAAEQAVAAAFDDNDQPIATAANDDTDPAAVIERTLEYSALTDALKTLPARERELLVLHYIVGLTLTDIGQRYNVSRQRAVQLKDKALSRLRKDDHLRMVVTAAIATIKHTIPTPTPRPLADTNNSKANDRRHLPALR